MRLTDLDPRWFGVLRWVGPTPFHVGLTFLCPHCRKTRIGVGFRPPIDPNNALGMVSSPEGFLRDSLWMRSGESFDCLTLSPSIDVSAAGHWHGSITNGEVA